MVTVKARIHGRVQGVWYRAWTLREARRRHLNGWVRNRADGTVEAVFSGPEDAVAGMIATCRQGPSAAHVTSIDITDAPGDAGTGGFVQRATR